MVDLEFANQFLVLAHAHRHPALLANAGNLALLRIATEEGLVPAHLAQAAAAAYRRYRGAQHLLRRNGAARALVDPAAYAPDIAAVRALSDAVLGT